MESENNFNPQQTPFAEADQPINPQPEAPVAPIQSQMDQIPQVQDPIFQPDPVPPKKSKKGIIIAIIAVILAAAIGVGSYFLFFKKSDSDNEKKSVKKSEEVSLSSPEEVIRAYLNVIAGRTELDEISDHIFVYMEDNLEKQAEEEDMDIEEYYEYISDGKADNYNDYIKFAQNQIRNTKYGKKPNIDIKSVVSEKLSSSKTESIKKEIVKECSFIDSDEISESYRVKAKFTISDDSDSETNTEYFFVIKYKDEFVSLGFFDNKHAPKKNKTITSDEENITVDNDEDIIVDDDYIDEDDDEDDDEEDDNEDETEYAYSSKSGGKTYYFDENGTVVRVDE